MANALQAMMTLDESLFSTEMRRPKSITLLSDSPALDPVVKKTVAQLPTRTVGFDGGTMPFDQSRSAARALAAAIPEATVLELYEEHGTLVEKHFLGGLTKRENARLTYVKWKLERIEDAEIGPDLDALVAVAEMQKAFAADVRQFVTSVKIASKPSRRR